MAIKSKNVDRDIWELHEVIDFGPYQGIAYKKIDEETDNVVVEIKTIQYKFDGVFLGWMGEMETSKGRSFRKCRADIYDLSGNEVAKRQRCLINSQFLDKVKENSETDTYETAFYDEAPLHVLGVLRENPYRAGTYNWLFSGALAGSALPEDKIKLEDFGESDAIKAKNAELTKALKAEMAG